jgi:hypothetical protein
MDAWTPVGNRIPVGPPISKSLYWLSYLGSIFYSAVTESVPASVFGYPQPLSLLLSRNGCNPLFRGGVYTGGASAPVRYCTTWATAADSPSDGVCLSFCHSVILLLSGTDPSVGEGGGWSCTGHFEISATLILPSPSHVLSVFINEVVKTESCRHGCCIR